MSQQLSRPDLAQGAIPARPAAFGYDFGQAGKAQIKADWGDKGRPADTMEDVVAVRRHRRRLAARDPRGQAAPGGPGRGNFRPSMAYFSTSP